MTAPYHCEALSPQHDRGSFECGVPELDRYFRQQVTQDIRRHVTSCFVVVSTENTKIAGYYTLASAGVPIGELPDELARRLPRYPVLPAARIGRLAVDCTLQGRGVGGLLLVGAAARAMRADQANYALLVDAKDDMAASFYRHFGFTAFASHPHVLFLPLATAAKLLADR